MGQLCKVALGGFCQEHAQAQQFFFRALLLNPISLSISYVYSSDFINFTHFSHVRNILSFLVYNLG